MRSSFARCCGDANIGLAEISADEQQRFVCDGGKGVAEAVAVVEGGFMASLPIPPVCRPCNVRLLGGNRHHVDGETMNQRIKLALAGVATSRLNYHPALDYRGRRDAQARIELDRVEEVRRVGLVPEDCEQCRRVDYH